MICSVVGWWLFMQKLTTPLACTENPWILITAEKNVSVMSHSSHFSSSVRHKAPQKWFISFLCIEKTNHIIVPSLKYIQEREIEEFNSNVNNSPLTYNRHSSDLQQTYLNIGLVQCYTKLFTYYIIHISLWHNMDNNQQWWRVYFPMQAYPEVF